MQKVIVVDDDRQVGLCLQKLIPWEELDMCLAGIAYSGEEGFLMAVEKSPDIIISDLVMPGMDGSQLCQRIMNMMSGVSFIFLTAYEDFEALRLAMRCHAADYVLKPIDRSKIEYLTDLLRSLKKSSAEKDFFVRLLTDRALEGDILKAVSARQSAYFSELFRHIAADSAVLAREPQLMRSICLRLVDLFFRAQDDGAFQKRRHEELAAQISEGRFTMDLLLLTMDLYSGLAEGEGQKSDYYQELCAQVKAYIDDRYASPALNLAAVAEAFSYSSDHLGRMFARTTGDTVLTCITNRRMAEAARLLSETELPIRSIAEAVGYDNPGHLTRIIKKYTGMTPQEYRERNAISLRESGKRM